MDSDPLRSIVNRAYGALTCEASVIRNWEQDSCGKSATAVVRVPFDGDMITYPTCARTTHTWPGPAQQSRSTRLWPRLMQQPAGKRSRPPSGWTATLSASARC